MATKTYPIKVKEIVKLRQKALVNGSVSLYLDIYWEGEREYDFLKLYLSAGTNPIERKQNKATIELAEQIKAQRLIDLQNGKYKINRRDTTQSFLAYFKKLTKLRFNSPGNWGNWRSAQKHLVAFANGEDITFAEVDEAWLNRFKNFLQTKSLSSANRKLSQNSCHSYYNKVRACLREAYEEKIIAENPAVRVRGIKAGESKREFLSWEEVQKLNASPCTNESLKRAFMFSILTGLRWSDIIKMTWSEVHGNEKSGWSIRYQQKKTKDFEVLPLNPQARTYLGNLGGPDERIFVGLKYSAYTNLTLSRWMMSAGILRNITFHCARHTHATLLLSQGVDIYVVSKLLGHKHIKTTEVYAKVTNLKKNEAVNMLPTLKE